MRWVRFLPVAGRRALVLTGLAALLCSASGLRAQPVGFQDPQADPLKFDLDVPLILIYQIKPDKTADFESSMAAIKAGLAKSEKPEVKAFAETLVLYKVKDAPVYIFKLDQPSKTISYNPVKLLYETGPFSRAEADEIYNKFKDTYTGIQPWPLQKVGG